MTWDIRLLIDTDLDKDVIDGLRERANGDISDQLIKAGLTLPSPLTAQLERASEYLTAAKVLQRDWAGGTTPDTHKIGEFSQKSGIQEQIASFEAKGEKAIKDYISKMKKGNYPEIFEVIENKTDTNV